MFLLLPRTNQHRDKAIPHHLRQSTTRVSQLFMAKVDDGPRGTQWVLRWPVVASILLILSVELLIYLALRLWVGLYELVWTQLHHTRPLRNKLRRAKDFREWSHIARQLDIKEKRTWWKEVSHSSFYNAQAVAEAIEKIRTLKAQEDWMALKEILLQRVFTKNRHSLGIHNEELYAQTYFGTKMFIHDFVSEVIGATLLIRDAPEEEISKEQKAQFFEEAIAGYGNSALCLSGGGPMGYFHFGVIKALFEAGLLPRIFSGTSAGALVAAIICVRTDKELEDEVFDVSFHKYLRAFEEGFWTLFKRMFTKGHVFDNEHFNRRCREVLGGDITFEEAYRKSGRILNITTSNKNKHGGQIVLNYLTAPNVVIWSSVVASSSIPGLLGPTTLISKNDSGELEPYRIFGECWADGSFTNDIPRKQLSEFFNVNYFIVSQTNPHIVPFIYYNRGSSGEPSPHIIGSRLRGGFINSTLESLLKLEMKKWLRLLSDLDLLPSLGGTDLRWIFLQNFTGNVTIHPKLDRTLLWAYAHIASDPSAQNFERYLLEGQRWTWPKLCMINNHLGFERTLHQARQSLSL